MLGGLLGGIRRRLEGVCGVVVVSGAVPCGLGRQEEEEALTVLGGLEEWDVVRKNDAIMP